MAQVIISENGTLTLKTALIPQALTLQIGNRVCMDINLAWFQSLEDMKNGGPYTKMVNFISYP